MVSFAEWLAGLRLVYGALQRPELGEHVFPRLPPIRGRRSALELSRVQDRALLLPAAVWLTGAWPRRALDQHRRFPIRAGSFIDNKRTKNPAWLVEAIHNNFPVTGRTRRPLAKVKIPSRLTATLARRSIDLGAVISKRLNRLQARH